MGYPPSAVKTDQSQFLTTLLLQSVINYWVPSLLLRDSLITLGTFSAQIFQKLLGSSGTRYNYVIPFQMLTEFLTEHQ